MADAAAVIADIVQGHFDAELVELAEALTTRKTSGDVDVAWSVRLGDLRIDKTNKFGHGITIGAAIELFALGLSVGTVDPKVSERDRLSILLADRMAKDAITSAEASKRIGADAFDAITVTEYVEHDLPKDDSGPETPPVFAG